MNKTFGYSFGGKVLFAVIIATVIFSNMLVLFFRSYFQLNELLTENLILYSLRNITLGAMAFFGMAIAEILLLQRQISSYKQKNAAFEKALNDSKKAAENTIEEANLKAKKMIFEAKKEADLIVEKKNRIESQLKEFIQAEKELILKYESEDEEQSSK